MRIPDHIVDAIFDASDLLEVVQEYVQIKRKGAQWWGLSPFNGSEKTPSFAVHPGKGIWKCFSTGKGGSNAVSFLMECPATMYSYREALEALAKRYGIAIPTTPSDEAAEAKRRAALEAIQQQHEQYFYDGGATGSILPAFVYKRGLKAATVQEWEFGYARPRHGDSFSNRLTLPIHNAAGDIVAFAGRVLDDSKPKWINSPDSELYHKGEVLFGLHRNRMEILQSDQALLVEGYFDVIVPWQYGIRNAVATCGTALTEAQARRLRRLTANVVIIRDADAAGRKAAMRDIEVLLAAGCYPRVVTLPAGHDPDSYVRLEVEFEDRGLRELISAAPGWVDYVCEAADAALADAPARIELIERVAALLRAIPNTLARAEYARIAATRLDADRGELMKACGLSPADGEEPAASAAELPGEQQQLNLTLRQGPEFFRRSWDSVQGLFARLSLAVPRAFQRSERGYVRVAYHDIKGEAMMIVAGKGEKTPALRQTDHGDTPAAVLLPPELPGSVLLLVHDEITAAALSALGIPAVGLPRPAGWVNKKNGRELHTALKPLLNAGQYTEVVYCLPAEYFKLPPGDEGESPYAARDAAARAEEAAGHLAGLNHALRGFRVRTYAMWPAEDEQHDAWIERYLLALPAGELDTETGDLPGRNIAPLRERLDDLSEATLNGLRVEHITYARNAEMLGIFHADGPQRFLDYHQLEQIGPCFQFRTRTYSVDLRTRQVELKEDDGVQPEVWVGPDGQTYARVSGGMKRIGNFSVRCIMQVKGRMPMNLYDVSNAERTLTRQVILSLSEFRDPETFAKTVSNLPGMSLHFSGTKQQLLDMQFEVHKDAPEAISLDGALGWYELESGSFIYVMGNGVLDMLGHFYPTDERGLLEFEGSTYFLPAFSAFLKNRQARTRDYEIERNFYYAAGNEPFGQWIREYLDIFGMPAHATFQFMVAAVYFNEIIAITRTFPHLFLEGVPGSGKTQAVKTALTLFGKPTELNLANTRITRPAFAAKFAEYSGAVNYIDEFNIQALDESYSLALKAAYSGQVGARMGADWTTGQIDYGRVTSATIISGQNPIYIQEALNERCLIIEVPKREHSIEEKEKFADHLRRMADPQFGQYLSAMISVREQVLDQFPTRFATIQAQIERRCTLRSGKADRLLYNWAIVVTPLLLAIEAGAIEYPLSHAQILDYAAEQVMHHDRCMIEKGVLDVLFADFIGGYFMERRYGLNDNMVWWDYERQTVNLQITQVYPKFHAFLRDTYPGMENTSKSEILRKLKMHPACMHKDAKSGMGEIQNNIWLGYARDGNTGDWLYYATGNGNLITERRDYGMGARRRKRNSGLQFAAQDIAREFGLNLQELRERVEFDTPEPAQAPAMNGAAVIEHAPF